MPTNAGYNKKANKKNSADAKSRAADLGVHGAYNKFIFAVFINVMTKEEN